MKTEPKLIKVQIDVVPQLTETDLKWGHKPFSAGEYDIFINAPVEPPEGHIWALTVFEEDDARVRHNHDIVQYGKTPEGLVRYAFEHEAPHASNRDSARWRIRTWNPVLDLPRHVHFVEAGVMTWIRYSIIPVMPPKPFTIIE